MLNCTLIRYHKGCWFILTAGQWSGDRCPQKRLEQVKAKALGREKVETPRDRHREDVSRKRFEVAISDSAEENSAPVEGDRLLEVGPLSDLLGLGNHSKQKRNKKTMDIPKVSRDNATKPVRDQLVRKALAATEKVPKKKRSSAKKQKALTDLASSLQTLITGKTKGSGDTKVKKKKAQEEDVSRWDDRKLERKFFLFLGEQSDRGIGLRDRLGNSSPEEEQRPSRIYPPDAHRPCPEDTRAGSHHQRDGDQQLSHIRIMTYFMLHLQPLPRS